MTETVEFFIEQGDEEVLIMLDETAQILDLGIINQDASLDVVIEGGAPGADGRPGSAGEGSGNDPKVFSFTQALATWLCAHDLHGYPQVTVVDGEGKTLLQEVIYDSTDVVRIEFGRPTVGKVFIL